MRGILLCGIYLGLAAMASLDAVVTDTIAATDALVVPDAAADDPDSLNIPSQGVQGAAIFMDDPCGYDSVADHLESLFGSTTPDEVLSAVEDCRLVMNLKEKSTEGITISFPLKEKLAKKKHDDQLLKDVATGKDVQAMLNDLEIAAKGEVARTRRILRIKKITPRS
eukprot:Gregarina_sp_Poly_1__6569@NODE_351_length_9317_cov_65_080541_g294_i0_p7_GENE_NODE_351_length_9317_cov_65_080541_g294_i0NODE_351_length_9317_cov_65_080541_g294_i0_p7_ORF_typecomplete_len167_score24_14_NODE_351_length_9317_cov_65_080541_g294_i078888388